MLKVIFHTGANKYILRIPKNIRLRVLEKVAELEKFDHPLQHPHVIKLEGGEERFRLRTGDYRIKFILRDSYTILVTDIDN